MFTEEKMYLCYVIETYNNYTSNQFITLLFEKEKAIIEKEHHINYLNHQLEQFKKVIFGSKREKFVPAVSPEQVIIDLDLPTDAVELLEETQAVAYTRKKSKKQKKAHPGRMEFSKDLPVEEIIIEPTEDVTGLKEIGKEITLELDITPAIFILKKYIRVKYARPNAQENQSEVIIADMPHRPIHKGIPGAGLLATVVTDKYVDHLPIYRQVKRYQRLGVSLDENTLSGWIQKSCDIIEPLYDFLRTEVLKQNYLQCDETHIKVLDKKLKGKCHCGFYWVYHSPHTKQLFFDYQPTRAGVAPQNILKDFEGILQSDAYTVYDGFSKRKEIKLSNCLTHARRKFTEAIDCDKTRTDFVLGKMQLLYAVEEFARENKLNYQERFALRQQKSVPVLKELNAWMILNLVDLKYSSPIKTAIEYSLVRWEKLCLYAHHGELEIDTNLVENAIRPVALGRKNYLFAGSHQAAQRAGMIYSFFAMCHYHKVNPHVWLKETLSNIGITKPENYNTLLPGFIQE